MRSEEEIEEMIESMEDRFKFRIVVNNEVYDDLVSFRFNLDDSIKCEFRYSHNGKSFTKTFKKGTYTLIQCTGLKDKNGTLIYEKDYLSYKENIWQIDFDKYLGVTLTNILKGDIIVIDDVVLYNSEVIGNVFEPNTEI